ncbi:PQQ-dependent sugar dehydrogenase [Variovorax saccharolyticus]|uniref:PQQ-dependent sugar dehydrogenase n=1 Tax=Variovorax saccharolyticus TaxID=3053516 RepID=UPI002575AD39|nr:MULTISPECIES: PQQ-dependent sugar dehydrogenase [unclassified Variovorax]MDM0018287.1 PQQ-dependent sugar dehydrogenase [Variovorax sp. J22R187]MDM0024521.1 PQQ-dependent sugar dehydrogenase [Variovorax sp. J31P216]
MSTIRQRTAFAVLFCAATAAWAQQPPAEEPGWAKGRPKTEAATRMAPVPAFPIPTAADQLPTKKFKLPPGFKVETWASGVLDARALRQGAKGNVFVSTLFVGSKVYAIPEKGPHEPKTIIDKMELATGIEYYKGALYVATSKQILRYDNAEDKLGNLGAPVVLNDKLPGGQDHSWRYLRIHDDKLYYAVGAPCNLCDPDERHARIFRMNLDGSNIETVARGVRNTVGFDFDPKTGNLWFTDNGRDWFSESLPNDELNQITAKDQHFGYPYCHQGNILDGEFGWGKSCDDYAKPAALLGPHAGALGLSFYRGKMFPAKYQGAMFIARHGPWNRTIKYADVAVAWPDGKGGARVEPFMTGFVENNSYLGRPVDFLVLKDGSMLVSDDHAGAIYRISYGGK